MYVVILRTTLQLIKRISSNVVPITKAGTTKINSLNKRKSRLDTTEVWSCSSLFLLPIVLGHIFIK